MICPRCGKPYFFIETADQGKCLKCAHVSEFELPSYATYHLDMYAGNSKLYLRTLRTDPAMREVVRLLDLIYNDSILEIGCGVGDYCSEISHFCKGVIGIDISTQIAASRFKNIRFLRASAEKLAFRDNTFDKALCINVIEHVVDPLEMLLEIRRVLKPRGVLILITPNLNFFLHYLISDETHLCEWDKEGLEKLLIHYFDVIDVKPSASMFKYYPFNLILSKMIKPDLLAICKNKKECGR